MPGNAKRLYVHAAMTRMRRRIGKVTHGYHAEGGCPRTRCIWSIATNCWTAWTMRLAALALALTPAAPGIPSSASSIGDRDPIRSCTW